MRGLPIAAIVAAVSTIALTQIASAADQGPPAHKAPVYKAPPPPPAPVYNWTGFYIGGNVGYGWGNANTDLTANGNVTSHPTCGCVPTDIPASFAFADSDAARPQGVIGGGQIGYNYQFSPRWVLGFEADIQGSGERASGLFFDPFVTSLCVVESAPGVCRTSFPSPGTVLTSNQSKINWFGTVRGRLGVLVSDQLLIYGTGGLAYGEVAVSGDADISAVAMYPISFTPTTPAFGASKTNVGSSIGGGVEGRISNWLPPNWTWKLEYLYLDLGSIGTPTTPFVLLPSDLTRVSNITGTITTQHTHLTDNIVRVGLNYQFH